MSTNDAVTALMALASSSSTAVEPSSSSYSMNMERTTCDKRRSLKENMFDGAQERNKFSDFSYNQPYKRNNFVPLERTYADKLPAMVNESASQGTIDSYASADSCLGLFASELLQVLDRPENCNTISWSKDGKSFYVNNHLHFENFVMPNSFTCIRPRFEDFLQKLHLLGFTKNYDSTETTLPLFRHESFTRKEDSNKLAIFESRIQRSRSSQQYHDMYKQASFQQPSEIMYAKRNSYSNSSYKPDLKIQKSDVLRRMSCPSEILYRKRRNSLIKAINRRNSACDEIDYSFRNLTDSPSSVLTKLNTMQKEERVINHGSNNKLLRHVHNRRQEHKEVMELAHSHLLHSMRFKKSHRQTNSDIRHTSSEYQFRQQPIRPTHQERFLSETKFRLQRGTRSNSEIRGGKRRVESMSSHNSIHSQSNPEILLPSFHSRQSWSL
jgi:hypothetical protein